MIYDHLSIQYTMDDRICEILKTLTIGTCIDLKGVNPFTVLNEIQRVKGNFEFLINSHGQLIIFKFNQT
jgi:hypothetical protein